MTPGSDTSECDQQAPDGVQTVAFVSLGCPKNLVDSEKMLGLLAEDGLMPVSYDAEDGGVDAVVVNTCGFLEASKQESLEVIREAIERKRQGEIGRVIVAGCLVQRHRAKMLDWAPGIDAMVGVFDRDRIVEAVRGGAAREARPLEGAPKYWIAGNALQAAKERGVDTVGLTVNGKDGKGVGYFESDGTRLRLTPRHYAYLRISEGCNQNCAFCTIPSIRGKMRSKAPARIIAEARELVRDGAFELNLIGQDTTSFGDDIGAGWDERAGEGGLPAMLRGISDAVGEEAGSGWIRLMYAYPSNFTDAMVERFAELCETGHLLPYIDIPLQHASDRILESMRRNVTSATQGRLMRVLRERVPGVAIRTTFISGFPGETEDDHKRLLEFVEEVGFDALGVFTYSREEGTRAGTIETDPDLCVPEEVKDRRREEIMLLQQELAFERAERMASEFDPQNPRSGRRFDVLIDGETEIEGEETSGVSAGGRLYEGRTYFQAPMVDAVTYVHSREALTPGELIPCTVVDSDGYDLIARPTGELEKRISLSLL
jgi:ribosomal protein S12 methylthiotransferase